MNATVREWLAKAEGDYQTAKRELAVVASPNFDAACFHAQQCIEKIMKAVLIHLDALPPRTHDLAHLDRLLTPLCKEWTCEMEDLRFLARAAVAFRYPGESADREDAAQALEVCTRLRESLLKLASGL